MVKSSVKVYSLSELALSVRQSVERAFPEAVAVCAEISQLNVNVRSGHCYLEFIEKAAERDSPVAKIPAMIWRNRYVEIADEFARRTGMLPAAGMSVLATVTVEFSELYGLKLFVESIDPTYTVGDMAMRRREIIETLREEGVSEMNRGLQLPRLMRRIAVISSETAAGYEDFIHQLRENSGGYVFYTRLFASVMQGEQTEESVTAALSEICENAERYDCVVMIRGGGAAADLRAFDSLNLARICAQFPLPLLTGIGHTRDESVVDMVACRALKTPTAVAAFLVERMAGVDDELVRLMSRVKESATAAVTREQEWMRRGVYNLHRFVSRRVAQARGGLQDMGYGVKLTAERRLGAARYMISDAEGRARRSAAVAVRTGGEKIERLRRTAMSGAKGCAARDAERLNMLGQKVTLLDPARLLSRGYTLTECGGRVLTSAAEVKSGESIVTHFADGEVKSTVD